jgi:hypothetical protein
VSKKNHVLSKLILCVSLIFGAMIGIPMRPDRVEETLRSMNRVKIQQVVSTTRYKGRVPRRVRL